MEGGVELAHLEEEVGEFGGGVGLCEIEPELVAELLVPGDAELPEGVGDGAVEGPGEEVGDVVFGEAGA